MDSNSYLVCQHLKYGLGIVIEGVSLIAVDI